MCNGAIANLVDEVGAVLVHVAGLPMSVSVDMSICFLSSAKVNVRSLVLQYGLKTLLPLVYLGISYVFPLSANSLFKFAIRRYIIFLMSSLVSILFLLFEKSMDTFRRKVLIFVV